MAVKTFIFFLVTKGNAVLLVRGRRARPLPCLPSAAAVAVSLHFHPVTTGTGGEGCGDSTVGTYGWGAPKGGGHPAALGAAPSEQPGLPDAKCIPATSAG